MSFHGWKTIVILAMFLGGGAGCRTMLPAHEPVGADGQSHGLSASDARGPSERVGSSPPGRVDSQVRPVSAEEPVVPAADRSSRLSLADRTAEFDDQEDSGLEPSDFYPTNFADTVKRLTGNGPNRAVARAWYDEGEQRFQEGEYEKASDCFKRAVKRAPVSPLQEDALFMLGESQFFLDRYPKAHRTYGRLLKDYEFTRHTGQVAARQFAIGRYWEQLNAVSPGWLLSFQFSDSSRPRYDTWGHALKAYESVRMHDPTGPLADDSIMATANANFLKRRFDDAGYNYDLIRKEYPQSEHQLNAHLLGMKSKLEMYQGPLYDGTPLEDAGKISERILVQFGPDELGAEAERVVQTQNYVTQEQARRRWAIAEYYDGRGYYGAARFYYQKILDEYPMTVAAERAASRLAEIEDYPAKPPNHFRFLTDLIPKAER